MLLPVERILKGGEEQYTSEEIAEEVGLPRRGARAAAQGARPALPARPTRGSSRRRTSRRRQVSKQIADVGLPFEARLEVARTLGRAMSQVAAAMREVTARAVAQPGGSERDVALAYAHAARELAPIVGPLLEHSLSQHLREQVRQDFVTAAHLAEGGARGTDRVAVCFADLVGFTRLGEEIPVERLSTIAGQLESLAGDVAESPVRLVKTIGDAAMLVSRETEPLLAAAHALVAAADEEGEDFPQLRAGLALGEAVGHAGDWYGRPVNLASRVTQIARPSSVLATEEVKEDVGGETWSWSFAGRRKVKGIKGELPLFRARPRAERRRFRGESVAWPAVADSNYDLIVIGSGPGGYVAAIRAAQVGLKTAVVEKDSVVGGRCLNYACIPAKAVLRSADLVSEVSDAGDFGIEVEGYSIDFAKVNERRLRVIKTLTGGVDGLFKKNGIEVIPGEASLTSGGVSVGGQEIAAGKIILATGSVARPIPGTEFGGRVIGTEGAWALEELPATMAVVGAGASGAEIASAYARLGVEVKLFEALDRVLPTEDADISKLAERGLKKQGMKIHTKTLVENVQTTDTSVTFTHGDESETVDYLVIAAGRGPDVDALGLEAAGVTLDEHGLIAVDGAMRTSAANVYAIGDLVHGPALAHKASDEGIIAAEDAAGLETHPLEYADIPRATFCEPNVGSFGLTEAQAKEAGYDVTVGKVQYGAVGAGTVYGDRTGLVKIVGDKKYGELLGGHIIGMRATELIQELVNAQARRGRLPRGGPHRPRAPDAVRGRDGSGPRGRRLADPRLIA